MKYIEIDQETDKTLAILCDIALKDQGMQALSLVNHVIASVKEKED